MGAEGVVNNIDVALFFPSTLIFVCFPLNGIQNKLLIALNIRNDEGIKIDNVVSFKAF